MKLPTRLNARVQKTNFEIVEGDITDSDADAIVSSDDVYLTMGGGVSLAIRRKAGDSVLEDIRKQRLPIPIADVVVTTAGRLPAKHIFHAITLDFDASLPTIQLISTLAKRILTIGNTLKSEHIALPLLGAGTAGLSAPEVLKVIAHALMYELASGTYQINKVSLVIFSSSGLQTALQELTQTTLKAQEIQWKIDKLQLLLHDSQDDEELKTILADRVEKAFAALRHEFHIEGLGIKEAPPSETSIMESGKKTREKLAQTITELKKELENKTENQAADRDAFSKLSTDDFADEAKITAVSQRIQSRAIEIKNLKELIKKYETELEAFQENQLQYFSDLLRILTERFNLSDLQTLCFYLDVDYENLSGASKIDKSRELLVYLKRYNQINALQTAVQKIRPDVKWPTPPSD